MKYPKKLDILGNRYKITTRIPKKYKDDSDLDDGLCDGTDKIIWFKKDESIEAMNVTVIHEISHAIMFSVGLNQVIDEDIQEIICESFANFFSKHVDFVFTDED